MTMDWYYEQKEKAKPITSEMLEALKNKNFHSGRPINVGDTIFFGMLQEPPELEPLNYAFSEAPMERNAQESIPELKITLITFHYDEINRLYKSIDNRGIIN